MHEDGPPRRARQPAVNIPAPVLGLLLAFVAVHLARLYLLDDAADLDVLVRYAFIPIRYADGGMDLPGGVGALLWTPLTYAFIHADWTHLLVNSLWMTVFGTAVARRFGGSRFLVFSAVCAVAGAGAHFLSHPDGMVPVVGASAAISGQMAAACRFMFTSRGPLAGRVAGGAAYRTPALSLPELFRTPRALAFLAIWFVLNFGTGIGSAEFLTGGADIAWEAHLGGFIAGLLLFRLFDPVPSRPAPSP